MNGPLDVSGITADDWRLLSPLLDAALDLPPGERAAWIDALPEPQTRLKPLLQRLLAAEGPETRNFLQTLPRFDDPASATVAHAPGDLVGPYRLERQIGIGGMGSVWRAERADGLVRRSVALKLPHRDLALRGLAERFARERDILAALENPSIARLYDAGLAQDGSPYLALEYVEGEPIDEYCRARRSDLRERLSLLLQVARAVAFAHARLIVHRDLKPSNILVDPQGRVHLLDFGIAKLLDPVTHANADTPLTQLSGRALTPDYASPEQLRGETIGVASDVYSLGVVLYELLTGTRPVRRPQVVYLADAPANLEVELRRPSEAVAEPGLRRSLRGDVDTIVLHALKRSPGERYATMAAFADDLEYYLRGDPVRARPDSRWYRTSKFVLRHKVGVTAGVVALLAILAGGATAWWQAQVARDEARRATAVQDFLVSIFRANSIEQPDPAKARQTTARELLAQGAKQIDASLTEVPVAKLEVLGTLAEMYGNLDLFDDAVALRRKQVALARSLYGNRDPRVARALSDLSAAMSGSRAVTERPVVIEEALRILDASGDRSSQLRATLLGEYAQYLSDTDQARALRYSQEGLRLSRAFPPSRELLEALAMNGWLLAANGQLEAAERELMEAVRLSQSLRGARNPDLPRLYAYLFEPQYTMMKFAAAEDSLRTGVEIARELKGAEDDATVQLEMRLGLFLCRTARMAEGLQLLRQAREVAVRTRGPADALYVPIILEMYGWMLSEAGRPEAAIEMLATAVAAWREFRPQSNFLLSALERKASAHLQLGDLATADVLLREAQVIRDALHDEDSNRNMNTTLRVDWLLANGQPTAALERLHSYRLGPGQSADFSFSALRRDLATAEVRLALGEYPQATEVARRVHERITASAQRRYLADYEAQAALVLGQALRLSGEPAQAQRLLRQAVTLRTAVMDPVTSLALAAAQIELAHCLLALGLPAEAGAWAAKARGIHATHPVLGEVRTRPLRDLEARLAGR